MTLNDNKTRQYSGVLPLRPEAARALAETGREGKRGLQVSNDASYRECVALLLEPGTLLTQSELGAVPEAGTHHAAH